LIAGRGSFCFTSLSRLALPTYQCLKASGTYFLNHSKTALILWGYPGIIPVEKVDDENFYS